MIYEVAEITVKAGNEASFESGVAQAAPLFLRAKGCHGVSLHRVVEHTSVYRLLVRWDTVDDHLVGFRESADFLEWRRLVSDYFAGPPVVTHSEATAKYASE